MTSRLSDQARATLREYGVTQAVWLKMSPSYRTDEHDDREMRHRIDWHICQGHLVRKGRVVIRRHGTQFEAQCSCGWLGPDRDSRSQADSDKRHHESDGHRGLVAGGWVREPEWPALHGVNDAAGRVLVFDPPTVLRPASGQRIRIEDYNARERQILAVEEPGGEIRRYGLRYATRADKIAAAVVPEQLEQYLPDDPARFDPSTKDAE